MIKVPSGASIRSISSGVITPDARPQFSSAHGVLAYFQPGQWTVRIEERRQQEHFGEDVDRIRGGGYDCHDPPVYLCARAANGIAEAEIEKFCMLVGLTQESRWGLELKNGEEQADLWGGLVEKIDTT